MSEVKNLTYENLILYPAPSALSFVEELGFNVHALMAAFAEVESNGNVFACRYESHYQWLYQPERFAVRLKITKQTEVIMQKTSWGLFQVMGAVAREYGYTDYLHLLGTDSTIGVQILLFAQHLSRLFRHYKTLPLAIAGYNAGFRLKDYNTEYYRKIKRTYNLILEDYGLLAATLP